MTDDQLSLVPIKPKRVKGPVPLASDFPIAHVVIDSPLPHLDRLFDYLVPASMDADAQPGVRVRIRFAGSLIDGWLISRSQASEHEGTLAALTKVVSPEPVLRPEILELARTVANRQAGILSDVLRSAIPNRHVGAEATDFGEPIKVPEIPIGVWNEYVGAQALISRSAEGLAPRAVVTTGADKPAEMLAIYAMSVASKGKSVLIVVPDRAAIDQVKSYLASFGAPEQTVATVTSDDGPATRYRNWLSALRGSARIVVGTRSAIFTPMPELAAICIWDDWNETLADPHSPYWHARDVAVLRSAQQETALVLIGPTMSTDAFALQPWLTHISRSRENQRNTAPRVRSAFDDAYLKADPVARGARVPGLAMQVMKEALKTGPVLVLVARTGYSPRLLCQTCRDLATCSQCQGPLVFTSRSSAPTCHLCGHLDTSWNCTRCEGTQLRAIVVGSERTAEEFGRAFPGIPIRSSSGDHILREVDGRPAIIVATSGATPMAADGYAAAILLDASAMLARPDLHASEETFAKWMECVSLVRPGGEVVVVAEPDRVEVQALIRHDPVGFATREMQLRSEVQLPPAVRLIALTGTGPDIDDLLSSAELPEGVVKRGPVPTREGQVRILLSTPRASAAELVAVIKGATASRSARKKGAPVNVRVDPYDI